MFGRKPRTFPVQRTVLSAPDLLTEVAQHYGLTGARGCELLSIGHNDHYRIFGSDGDYVVRVYGAGWRSLDEILWELSLLEHLEQQGVPVSSALKTAGGSWYGMVQAPEGLRHVVLFKDVPDRARHPEGLSVQHARAYGRAVASLHNAGERYESRYPRFALDLTYLLGTPLQALWSRLASRPEDLTYVRDLIDKVRATIIEMEERGLARGVCHGDADGNNGHLDERGNLTLTGFDFAGPGWYAYDLATFRWSLLRRSDKLQTAAIWDTYLRGYREQRSLALADEQASAPFVVAREVWLMGLHAATGPDLGFGRMDHHYFDRSIELLKNWDKDMLG